MAIISISRAYCSKGKLIAEKVAEQLGYECISSEIILKASDTFNVTEIKLADAMYKGPTFLERITKSKEIYIAYIRAALLNYMKKDNIVYHGVAGHFFLQGISHAIKIRIISDFGSRVSEQMAREKTTEAQARKTLADYDNERRKWSKSIYNIDTTDPTLYDLILNINHISVDDCISMISQTLSFPSFQTNTESKRKLDDMSMAATAKALIINKYYDALVSADNGNLNIVFPKRISNKSIIISDIEKLLKDMADIKHLYIKIEEEITPGSLMYMANR